MRKFIWKVCVFKSIHYTVYIKLVLVRCSKVGRFNMLLMNQNAIHIRDTKKTSSFDFTSDLRPPIRSTLDIHKTVIISTSSGFRHDVVRLLCQPSWHTRHQLRKVDHAETGGRPGRLKGLWSLARDSYKETYPTWPTSLRAQTWRRLRESVTDRRQQSPISWLIIEISCLQFRAASVPSKAASLSIVLCLRSRP